MIKIVANDQGWDKFKSWQVWAALLPLFVWYGLFIFYWLNGAVTYLELLVSAVLWAVAPSLILLGARQIREGTIDKHLGTILSAIIIPMFILATGVQTLLDPQKIFNFALLLVGFVLLLVVFYLKKLR
ncbi:MAG: hypothetical protein ACTSVM_06715 [Candidatus Ranarchaeia archaeon]